MVHGGLGEDYVKRHGEVDVLEEANGRQSAPAMAKRRFK
jgi:hypothetical protein